MSQVNVFNIVSRTIQDTFLVDESDINRDTVAIDIPGWDSLSHVILLSNIEEEIGSELDLEKAKFSNVGELVDFIEVQILL